MPVFTVSKRIIAADQSMNRNALLRKIENIEVIYLQFR